MASAAKLQKKDVKYLGRDFSAFRENLIEFAKTYFPNTYNDFNESDPGMMFIEMASYVGDVLSYYVPSSTDYNPLASFNGNVFYDVASTVDKKIKALKVYDEEMRAHPHSRSYRNIENLMETWGAQVGLQYAERFQSIRRVIC